MPFVAGNQNAVIRHRSRGNNHIDWAARLAGRAPLCHNPAPLDRRTLVKWKDAAAEQCPRTLQAYEPSLQLAAPPARNHLHDRAPNLCNRERRDEEVVVGLSGKPIRQRFRNPGFRRITDDVGVEQITRHKSTSRGGTTSRSRFRSAPTHGDARTARHKPPRVDSGATAFVTSFRRRAASASSAESFFANLRTSSLSCAKPRTS